MGSSADTAFLKTRADDRKVLVTGVGSGVGSSIARALASSGVPVLGTFRTPTPAAMQLVDLPDISLFQGDLRDESHLVAVSTGVRAVVHCAAATDCKEMSELVDANVQVVQGLLRHAANADVQTWIQLSTVSVHGEVRAGALDRSTGFVNPSPYGLSKRIAEVLLQEASEAMSVRCLRLPAVLAPGARHHWLARVIANALLSEPIAVHSDALLFNNTVHIDDLCAFVISLLARPRPGFDVFPIASRESVSVLDLVSRIIEWTGSESRIVEDQVAHNSFVIDDTYARNHYSYTSRTTVEAVHEFITGVNSGSTRSSSVRHVGGATDGT